MADEGVHEYYLEAFGAVADGVGNLGGVVSGLSTSHARRWRAGGDHAMDKDSSTGTAEEALFSEVAWFDPLRRTAPKGRPAGPDPRPDRGTGGAGTGRDLVAY